MILGAEGIRNGRAEQGGGHGTGGTGSGSGDGGWQRGCFEAFVWICNK